jgi:hypothetical protein
MTNGLKHDSKLFFCVEPFSALKCSGLFAGMEERQSGSFELSS